MKWLTNGGRFKSTLHESDCKIFFSRLSLKNEIKILENLNFFELLIKKNSNNFILFHALWGFEGWSIQLPLVFGTFECLLSNFDEIAKKYCVRK